MEKMNKRELLRKQVLELFSRGIEVYQTQLDNSVDIDDIEDEVILEQIKSLKELRDRHPKLTRDINDDLNVLMSQINPVDIKNYNKINFLIQNNVENEYVKMMYWLSIFENSGLTQKQRQLLIDFVSGCPYTGNAKDYEFMIKKLQKSKGGKCMNDDKRKFSADEMRKLFPNYYAKPNTYFDEYLNFSRKPDCYNESVAESKRTGDYYRQLSLKYSIFPYPFDENNYESLD